MTKPEAIAAALKLDGLITEEELGILADLALSVDARVVVETGTFKGRTATLFAQLGATVFTIDDHSGRWARYSKRIDSLESPTEDAQLKESDANLKPLMDAGKVFVIRANSFTEHDFLAAALSKVLAPRPADLVFLDGNHAYEAVFADLKLAALLIRPGGIICGHDLDMEDTVLKALKQVRGDNFEKKSAKLWAYHT